jgi:hypothetical protein
MGCPPPDRRLGRGREMVMRDLSREEHTARPGEAPR